MSLNAEAVKRHARKKRSIIWEYKRSHPCVDCGESDPVVLDLDHVNPKKKTHNMKESRRGTVWWKLSYANLFLELGKCEVRCANCHRRRTALQQGWPV